MSERAPRFKRHGARYKARRRAVDILFESESRDLDPLAVIEDRRALAVGPDAPVAPIADYTADIVQGVAVELDTIDDTIEEYTSDDWALTRLPAVDRAILRVATWELLFNPDVPVPTAVVEAVEIASEYSVDSSSAYINATLDAMAGSIDTLRKAATGADVEGSTSSDAAESQSEAPAGEEDTPVAPWDDSVDDPESSEAPDNEDV